MRSSESPTATLLSADDWRELASRENHGLTVSILWSGTADQVKLTVADSTYGEEFEIAVPGADALEAFHHPFAYMATRGRGRSAAVRASLDLQPQG